MARKPVLTIGMATFDDFDGVYFTIQSIRISNQHLLDKIEFIVIDNNPNNHFSPKDDKGNSLYPNHTPDLIKFLASIPNARYIPFDEYNSTCVKNKVFEYARADIVMCVDCHVILDIGVLDGIIAILEPYKNCKDLIQGPLWHDNLNGVATHFDYTWSKGMRGTWQVDPRGKDKDNPPFDIPSQGCGLMVCRKDAWVEFNPLFRGFGGEEGYIHEKFRQNGGRTVCFPFARWNHRFGRPNGIKYPLNYEDRIRNYFLGFTELGQLDEIPAMVQHFSDIIGIERVENVLHGIQTTA